MANPPQPVNAKARRKTVVLRRLQYLFASKMLLVHLVVSMTLYCAIQLKINTHILDHSSLQVTAALEGLSRDIALAFLVVGFSTGGLVVMVALWLSNHIVGPVPRLRAALQRLAAGDTEVRLSFRPGDMLEEIAPDVNALAAALAKGPIPTPQEGSRPPDPEGVSGELEPEEALRD